MLTRPTTTQAMDHMYAPESSLLLRQGPVVIVRSQGKGHSVGRAAPAKTQGLPFLTARLTYHALPPADPASRVAWVPRRHGMQDPVEVLCLL